MQRKRNSILAVLLALLTVGCSETSTPPAASTTPTPDQASDVVFKTPEEAITSYFEGLAQNDLPKILQACAIDEMSEKFKFDLYTERLGGILPPATSLAPADYALYAETNKAQLSSQILNRLKIFAYSLLSSEKIDEGSALIKLDADGASRFMKEVDPHRLSKLEIKKISPPNKTLMSSAKYLESAAKNAAIYGADESTERVALFSFEQNYYFQGFTLLRYGENWKISLQTSPLGGTSALGTPQQTTVEEFESMISK